MAFWKFIGIAPEAYPSRAITAQPGYVYDFGSYPPPTEPAPADGSSPNLPSRWVSSPGPATTAATSAGEDGILVIGQSNARGAGTGYVVPQLDPVDPRIRVWAGSGTYAGVSITAVEPIDHVDTGIATAPQGVGPGVPFAREWIKRQPVNRTACVIAAAFGGTPFEGNDSKATTRQWKVGATGNTQNLYENAISMTQAWLATNPTNRLVAIIWAHGEQDSSNGTSAANYQADLDALIDGLRSRLGVTVPFLIAQMTPETIAGGSGATAIDAVQQATPTRKSYVGFAAGPGTGKTDATNGTLHWSAAAQRYFGPALYTAYQQALTTVVASQPAVVAAPVLAPAFLQDTFTDTAGVSLATHTSDTGATWSRSASTATGAAAITAAGRIRSNAAATTTYIASATPTSADQTATLDFYVASVVTGTSFGVYIRGAAQPASSYTGYAVRYVVSSTQWQLVKIVSGTATVLGTLVASLSAGETHSISVSAIGSTITATVDGATVASVTDTAITTAGQVSLTWTGATAGTDTTGFHGDNLAVR